MGMCTLAEERDVSTAVHEKAGCLKMSVPWDPCKPSLDLSTHSACTVRNYPGVKTTRSHGVCQKLCYWVLVVFLFMESICKKNRDWKACVRWYRKMFIGIQQHLGLGSVEELTYVLFVAKVCQGCWAATLLGRNLKWNCKMFLTEWKLKWNTPACVLQQYLWGSL